MEDMSTLMVKHEESFRHREKSNLEVVYRLTQLIRHFNPEMNQFLE